MQIYCCLFLSVFIKIDNEQHFSILTFFSERKIILKMSKAIILFLFMNLSAIDYSYGKNQGKGNTSKLFLFLIYSKHVATYNCMRILNFTAKKANLVNLY